MLTLKNVEVVYDELARGVFGLVPDKINAPVPLLTRLEGAPLSVMTELMAAAVPLS